MRLRHRLMICLFIAAFAPATFAQEKTQVLQRIAFGSCARHDRPQPIWKSVVSAKPQLFLFLGDNIYGDTEDMKVLKAKYDKLAAMPGYQRLRKTCTVMATWDDHDYGVNDGGLEYPRRRASQQIFLDFFRVPKNSPRRKQQGVYHARLFGPADKRVQIIMLDTRYFRSPLKKKAKRIRGEGPYEPNVDAKATMLGEAQWKWLAQQLKVPAKLRIIGSSIQVVPEDHGWEKWTNFPHERERLFKLIRDTKASGVVFLSGDRHLAEISMMDGGVGYPLYDLTSSGLNNAFLKWRPQEKNRHRVATMNFGNNFGLIDIDWKRNDPLLRFQIRDEAGDIILQQKVLLSTLKRGVLEIASYLVKLQNGKTLTYARMKDLMGEKISIQMTVKAVGKAKQMVYLNSAPDWRRKDNFTVVVYPSAQKQFERMGIKDVGKHFLRKSIHVSGVLTEYNGLPQIRATTTKQILLRQEK